MTRDALHTPLLTLAALASVACGDTTPRWQLAHDRILAVRITPAELSPGERASIDVLVTTTDGIPLTLTPTSVIANAATPAVLASALASSADGWSITAPDAAVLAEIRTSLQLAADARVPLDATIEVSIAGQPRYATKRIWLGAHRDNPSLGAITIDGQPLVAGVLVGDELALRISDPPAEVRWLTSVGSLDRDDHSDALLRVDDATSRAISAGTLAVVIRDALGGVAWGHWPISIRSPISAHMQ